MSERRKLAMNTYNQKVLRFLKSEGFEMTVVSEDEANAHLGTCCNVSFQDAEGWAVGYMFLKSITIGEVQEIWNSESSQ